MPERAARQPAPSATSAVPTAVAAGEALVSGEDAPALIVAASVAKRFGSVQALADVSLEIREREFVSIVGPSGCGKSTLLELIAGLQQSDGGTLSVGGAPCHAPRDDTAVIFQEASTLPWRNVLDNVAFILEARGVNKRQRHDVARGLVDLVGLRGFEKYYPSQLSGGMRQRVAIARGLTANPRLLLADEPFGALDEQTRLMLVFELLKVTSKSDCAVMLITHSIQEAVLASDRVFVMSRRPGRIIGELTIDLPRPRSTDLLGSTKASDYMKEIWDILAPESMRALNGEAAQP